MLKLTQPERHTILMLYDYGNTSVFAIPFHILNELRVMNLIAPVYVFDHLYYRLTIDGMDEAAQIKRRWMP